MFPRPASTQDMRRMEDLTEEELDSEFLQQANTFCAYIYKSAQPKTVKGGRTITGTGTLKENIFFSVNTLINRQMAELYSCVS